MWTAPEAEPEARVDDERDQRAPVDASKNVALSLTEVVNAALRANRSLLNVRDGALSAEYSLVAARSAFELKVFPRLVATESSGDAAPGDAVGFGVEFRKLLPTGTEVSVGPSIDLLDDTYSSELAVTLNQPLLRGANREVVRAFVDAAEFSARTARRELYRAQVATVFSTIGAAYQVVRQAAFLRLSEESAARLEGHARAARARERAGLASSLDVFRATLEQNEARDSLVAAQEAYEDALDLLRVELALPLSAELAVDLPLMVEPLGLTEAEAVQVAMQNRVELEQADENAFEAERRSRVARDGTRPDLDLSVSFGRFGTSDDLSRSLDLDQDALSVSLLTSSDLSRTAERAFFEQTRLDVASSLRSRELVADQVVREVRAAFRALRREAKRVEIQEDQIRQAKSKLAVARVKFDRALATNFDLIEAEDELRTAETNLISATIAYIVGTYRLRVAMGTLLERPQES